MGVFELLLSFIGPVSWPKICFLFVWKLQQKLGSYISTTALDMDTLLNEHLNYIPTKTLSNLQGIIPKSLWVLGGAKGAQIDI